MKGTFFIFALLLLLAGSCKEPESLKLEFQIIFSEHQYKLDKDKIKKNNAYANNDVKIVIPGNTMVNVYYKDITINYTVVEYRENEIGKMYVVYNMKEKGMEREELHGYQMVITQKKGRNPTLQIYTFDFMTWSRSDLLYVFVIDDVTYI